MDSKTWLTPALEILIFWTFLLLSKDHSSRAAVLTSYIGHNTSVGKQVTLQCNSTHLQKIKQITWRKDVFRNSTPLVNCRSSCSYGANVTERIRADPADPAKLQISDVQLSDEGDYTCEVISSQGNFKTIWHLDVEQENNGLAMDSAHQHHIVLYTSLAAIAMFSVSLVIFCTRKQMCVSYPSDERHKENDCSSNTRQETSSFIERTNSLYEGIIPAKECHISGASNA
ncbi:cell surface glycoprotein CD200 receptor 1-like [Acipenser ruthenus]|uniref:cell surface glycoprotein CD200 receptor 1-like n=1 Tax=Acipenser ruthenus TaxID=7906 RepID=UPI00274239B0|nr:cell surface glycoprotein CD200 receptor 1-like [Acipenser ruthenus]